MRHPIAISAHFLTVSVKATNFKDPQPGNTHPSLAIFVAENLSNLMVGATNAVRDQLGAIVHRMVLVSQKMRPGGDTTWWQQVPDAAEEMSYECDAKLGAPNAADCARVEYGELGLDDDTFSLTGGLAKVLSSGQCSRCLDDSRSSVLTRTCQVRVNLLSRQRQPSRSTGAKSGERWTLSSISASILRSTQAPAAGLLLGI